MEIHPDVPNAGEMQRCMDEISERELRPFFETGNVMTRELYKELVMPWMVVPRVECFGDGGGEREGEEEGGGGVFRKFYGREWGNEGEYVGGGEAGDGFGYYGDGAWDGESGAEVEGGESGEGGDGGGCY